MHKASWRVFSCIFVGALLLTPHSHGADWPTYLYDNARRGFSPEKLSMPLSLRWVYTSPEPPETAWEGPRSQPFEGLSMRHRVNFDNVLHVAVGGNLLFFGSSVDNKVICVDTETGEIRWQFLTDGSVRLTPTYAHDHVYFGADDGYVYCLTAADGQLVWKLRAGKSDDRLLARGRMISRWPIRTGVVVDGKVAYFGAGVLPHETVYLYAVNSEDGSVLWRNDTISSEDAGRNPLSPQGYLLCSEQRLIVPSGRSLPAAFDKSDGHELYQRSHSWRTTAGGVVGGTKAVLADGQIYASGPHHFLALDEQNGAVGFAWIDGRQLVIGADKAFVADGKQITAIDRAKHAHATIERQKLRLQVKELAAKRRNMDAQQYNTEMGVLNKQIAELSEVGVLWKTDCSLDASLVAGQTAVLAGGQGQIVALDAATGRQIWDAKVDGEVGGLALANERLFASTTTGKIYCFAGPVAAATSENSAAGKVVQIPAPALENPYPRDELTDMYATAAQEILKQTGIERGYCLVVGSEQGRLAYELARRSKLRIYGIEPDAEKALAARTRLDQAALHGTRVTILPGDPSHMPFSNSFANLIVSDHMLLSGQVPGDPAEIVRCLKPCGGVACLELPRGAPAWRPNQEDPLAEARQTIDEMNLAIGGKIQQSDHAVSITRGPLPGAGEWSHQYGDAANTMTSRDQRVRGDLGVLWYGDPGPNKMINRHDAAAAPLLTGGRMFIQGFETIMAYDAYNGLFLWEYQNPGAIRTGVFNNEDTSNFAASEDHVFSVVADTCTVLDAATGQVVRQCQVPESSDALERIWGYVGHYEGMLFGTSTLRKDLDQALRRRGLQVGKTTDALFAIDVQTGTRKWVYRGGSIEHVTIAIGDDRVFFIDSSITREQREALLRRIKRHSSRSAPKRRPRRKQSSSNWTSVWRSVWTPLQASSCGPMQSM